MNLDVIIGSVVVAFIHGFIETYFIIMESKANKTTFMNYLIICFNGRFGFFPFSDYIGNQNKKDKKKDEKVESKDEVLDYDNIKSKAFGVEFPLEY